MKLEICEYEQPHTLRALARLLNDLADAPSCNHSLRDELPKTAAFELTPIENPVVACSEQAPPPAALELATDATGAPWDERIHSSSRTLIADGTWKMKRGAKVSERAPPEGFPLAAQSVAAPPAPPMLFNEIMRFYAANALGGKLGHADMDAMAAHVGAASCQELMQESKASLRPAALEFLKSVAASRAA